MGDGIDLTIGLSHDGIEKLEELKIFNVNLVEYIQIKLLA